MRPVAQSVRKMSSLSDCPISDGNPWATRSSSNLRRQSDGRQSDGVRDLRPSDLAAVEKCAGVSSERADDDRWGAKRRAVSAGGGDYRLK